MTVRENIIKNYGEPGKDYVKKYCVVWDATKDFPWLSNVENGATPDPNDHVTRILINTDFKARLMKAFRGLEQAGLHTEIKTYDGCYNERQVRGKNVTSLHAWAMAIDLNAETEKLAQLETNWSRQFIAIMKAAGLAWGGDWTSRKDSMHFALFNG